MNRKLLWMFVWLLLPLCIKAQLSLPLVWTNYLETLYEDGEDETVEELQDLYDACVENPFNLNDTAHILQEFPFVSDVQRGMLRSYILLYGELMSVEELYSINGFDSLTVELLRPLVKGGHNETWQPLDWSKVLRYGRSNMVTGINSTIEQARGYKEDIYQGNNLRMLWRYSFKYKDRVQLHLSADKDPGEALFSGSQGFDFYGYSLTLNDIGRNAAKGKGVYLKKIILGQYHAQFGQGLTAWSGFGTRRSLGTGISRHASGLRPNGVFSEYGYLQGAAAEISLSPKWKFTTFLSYTKRSATLPRGADKDSTINWVQSLYNSGYHRTQTEINKKRQLGECVIGGHIERATKSFKAGMTAMATLLDKELIPATYVYNDNAFRGRQNFNIGVDAAYLCGRLMLFGEAALCVNHAFDQTSSPSDNLSDSIALNVSPAVVAGGEFIMNNNHRMSAQLHYYSPNYHNLHACAIGQGSTPQNEAGAGLYYQGHLPGLFTASAIAEFAYFPHEKYLAYAPTHGSDVSVVISRPLGANNDLMLNVRYRYKDRGRNITPSTMVDGKYQMEQTYRHQILADVEYASGAWKSVTRLGWTSYHGDVTEVSHGLLLYEDVQFKPKCIPLMVAARVALFDVEDYEARLYAVESGFIYQYNSMMFQDEGCRLYLLLRYDINKYWNVGFKYGITSYGNKDTFGSGYELIDANHRQQWNVQVRVKW